MKPINYSMIIGFLSGMAAVSATEGTWRWIVVGALTVATVMLGSKIITGKWVSDD